MEGGSLHQAIRAAPREAEIAYIVKNVFFLFLFYFN